MTKPTKVDRRLLLCAPLLLLPAGVQALNAPAQAPVLDIIGAVGTTNQGAAAVFDLAMLSALPQHRIKTRTPWHEGERVFAGPLVRDVLAAAKASGTSLRMVALNDYRVDVPMDDVQRWDVIIATSIDGRAIPVREKGPLFIIYPFDRHPDLRNAVYYSRSIWQLRRVEVR
jgi:hypothetical protein